MAFPKQVFLIQQAQKKPQGTLATSNKQQATSDKRQAKAPSYKLQATSYKLQATSYKLQATSYKLTWVELHFIGAKNVPAANTA